MVIGRGRRREHPQPTLFTTTTGVAQLPVVYAPPKGTPKGSSDLWSHPVAMLLLLRKTKTREKAGHAHNLLPIRTASGHGLFRSRDFVTSGQKVPLGQIWRNFRLHMRRTYFRTGYVTDITSGHDTSGHVTDVTSGHAQCSDPPQILICPYPYTTYVLLRVTASDYTYGIFRLFLGRHYNTEVSRTQPLILNFYQKQ